MSRKICKVKECSSVHKAKGYCRKHYIQIKRYGKIKERTTHTKNEFILDGNICRIKLYNKYGKEKAEAIIDSGDLLKVKNYKWGLRQGRVVTDIGRKRIGIQHIILGISPSRKQQIDHKHHNLLDNRKSKLRLCSNKQNSRNKKIYVTNTSGYKGVCQAPNTTTKKWVAYIHFNYRKKHLGTFNTPEEAAKAYDKAALIHHKKFARLNFVSNKIKEQ